MHRILICLLTGLLLPAPAAAQRAPKKSDVAPPTGITFSYTSSALTISWTAAAGATKYTVLRRLATAQDQLGQVSTTTYTGSLPARGTAYEYQVVSVGRIGESPSPWIPYTVPAEVTAVLMPPPSGTAMVMPAPGPAQLTAVSLIPASIQLSFSPVPNATAYRIFRAISGYTGFQALRDAKDMQMVNGQYISTDGPIDFRWTYQYKVQAVFQSATGEVLSSPSPVASAKSLPYVQVSGLTYTVKPSISRIGTLDVTLDWTPVKDVLFYSIFEGSGALIYEMFTPGTNHGYVWQNLVPKYTYTACVAAAYAYRVMDTKTAPCVEIKL